MATGARNSVLWHLRRAALLRDGAGLADGELLECYVARRDEDAFEALLRRHGPMVLGVCRRVLRNEADAVDAFQATFLVLVRKADTVRPPGQVSNWLYGVAYRTALKARAQALRRRAKEREAALRDRGRLPDADRQHLHEVLDQELHALPDPYRVPLVLCDLEGKTRKEAARQLGWPEGTVASRVARGRCLLARRLTRHGLTCSGGALAVLLTEKSAAALPLPLAGATAMAAAAFAAGQAAGAIPASVTALAEGVLGALFLNKLKALAGPVLVVALIASAAGYSGRGLASEVVAGARWLAAGGRSPAPPPPEADPGLPANAVCAVEWGGKWWPAFIRTSRGGEYFIHYTGYDDSWDEWVKPDRLRLLRVSVERKGEWRPAVLLRHQGEQFYVRYDGPDEAEPEWVPRERVRSKGCRVEWGGQWWRAEVLQVEGSQYKIRYVGYDDSWDEWVGGERVRFTLHWDDSAALTDDDVSETRGAAEMPPGPADKP